MVSKGQAKKRAWRARLGKFLYAACKDPQDPEQRRQAVLVQGFPAVAIIVSLFFGVAALLRNDLRLVSIILVVISLTCMTLVVYRITRIHQVASGMGVLVFCTFIIYMLVTGGTEGTGLIWAFALSPTAIFALGHRWGTLVAGLFVSVAGLIVFGFGEWLQLPYSEAMQGRWFGALVFVSVVSAITERSRHRAYLLMRDQVQVRREAEAELQQAMEVAEEAARIKGEFLANMSHELRTPLTSMVGMNALLLDTELSDEQREFSAAMKKSGDHLVAIVNDVLDLSKMEADRVVLEQIAFDPGGLTREVYESFKHSADEKSLDLELVVGQSVPTGLVGDPARIRQVLNNLIGNAIKFTKRGSVRILLEAERATDGIVPVRWTVIDTGIGVSEDKQVSIFDAFHQADGSTTRLYGGTGLGLAISRRLVKAMRGRIDLESRVGQGASFSFELVLKLASESASEAGSAPLFGPVCQREGRSVRLLVVEDDMNNRSLLQLLFDRLGCDVELACNGAEAIEMVADGHYDLVFMDCHMPQMDGFQATEAIRLRESNKGDRRTTIIAVTANVTTENRDRCAACGMDDFLMKPLDASAIENTLRRWLPDSAEA